MGYIEESLGAEEVLISRARFHWLYHAAAWAVLALFMGAAILLLSEHQSVWLIIPVAALGLFGFLAIMIPIWTTEIGVTNQRVIIKRGLLARHSDEIELWAIEEANLDQSVLGRLFGFGRISIQGTGDDALQIPAIADPVPFQKAIQGAIGRMTRPTSSAARPSSPMSRPQRASI
jgi:uncharacterized membrane protein YdbT with pleckstrin-like domain